MKFKPGDKVRFLNQSGGGIVTKIISPQMVHVAIEDGFEIPILTNELLMIDTSDAGSRFFDKVQKTTSEVPNSSKNTASGKSPVTESEDYDRIFSIKKSKGADAETIWLAFRPHDQKWLITGLIDVCLLNPTDYDMLYSFMVKKPDHQWIGADYDVLPPESGITVTTLSREELSEWLEGSVQMLFQKETQPRLIMPVNSTYRLKPSRFLKEDNYIQNNFAGDKLLMVSLTVLQARESSPESLEGADLPVDSRIKVEMPKALIDKHRIAPFEAEVDLHISMLEANYSKLSNFEILKIQTDYFQKCLGSALEAQYRRIIFIHGIGNGTLRSAIVELLKPYEELTVQNAPFKKYGYGAIEVINGKPE